MDIALHLRLPHGEVRARQGHVPRADGGCISARVEEGVGKSWSGLESTRRRRAPARPVGAPAVESGSVESGQPFKYNGDGECDGRASSPRDYEGWVNPDRRHDHCGSRRAIEGWREQACSCRFEGRDGGERRRFVSRIRGIRGGRSLRGATARGRPAWKRSRVTGEQGRDPGSAGVARMRDRRVFAQRNAVEELRGRKRGAR